MPNLRKILIVLAAILISQFSIFNPQFSIATTPLDKAQEDYTFQFTKYREEQSKYITARSSYMTFNTTVSKSDAFLATKNYLYQIDNLYLSYILLVNEHANSLNWTNSTLSKELIEKIASEQTSYLKDHQEKVSRSSTLEELPVLAAELKKYVDTDFIEKNNKTLAILEIAETESALTDFNELTGILDQAMISKNQQAVNQIFYDNWTSEISDIRTKAEAYKEQAKAQLAKTKDETASGKDLASISNSSNQAKKELQRSKALFEEVIKIL